MYVITVQQLHSDPTGVTIQTSEVFKQQVETVDLSKVFAAVNARPRKARKGRVEVIKPEASK